MKRYKIDDTNLKEEDSIIDILSDNKIEFDFIEDVLYVFEKDCINVENILKENNILFNQLEGETRVYQFDNEDSFEGALETLYMLNVDYEMSPDNLLIEVPNENFYVIEKSLNSAKIEFNVRN